MSDIKLPAEQEIRATTTREPQSLVIERVDKFYDGDVHAVKEMSLSIEPGEFMVLVGPSGCGKSTMLRMLAGLEDLNAGHIFLGGRKIDNLPPKSRDVAMVFQNYALYPTMKVYDNLAFPLKMRKWKKDRIRARVTEVAEQLGLQELLQRRPSALSGGQRQRVALGRAMVRDPALFLMDEPLSNLDAELRVQMRHEIVSLQRQLGTTTVYVTHDQVEAMTMGTRIAVMRDGVLQQADDPRNIYRKPNNLFVARFIGSPPMNIWHTRLLEDQEQLIISIGEHFIPAPENMRRVLYESEMDRSEEIALGLRPEDVYLAGEEEPGCTVPAQVADVEQVGRENYIYLRIEGITELFTLANSLVSVPAIGENIRIGFHFAHLHMFDVQTGLRLSET